MINFSRYIILLITSFLLCSCGGSNINQSLTCMSFNIRYDNPRDGINTWNNRKEMVVETIVNNEVDVVGMQEVLLSQQKYLEEKLTDYDHYAIGRDDGKTRGEMGSIFFLKNKFDVLDKASFWLSETPSEIGSKGWNAVLPRIVSWVKFQDLENDRVFYFFNTHFSHVGEEARVGSAQLLVRKVAEIAGDYPVIISGDFNCTKDSKPYSIITDDNNGLPKLFDAHFITETEHSGGLNTINGFGRSGREAIIDYLFCNSSFKVNSHGILTIKKDSVFVSDHYPVVAEFIFEK